MSLLSIAQALAKNVGMAVPDVVVTSTDRQWVDFLNIANQAGEELARRVDWGQLTEVRMLTGDGTFKTHTLPDVFSRILPGIAVTGNARPLSRAEWASLDAIEGVPRYFLLEGRDITFWPYLATGEMIKVDYQSKGWASNGFGYFLADEDTSLIDEDLFLKCCVVRWRRQKGMDYADYEAEFESALGDFAGFNDRSRL